MSYLLMQILICLLIAGLIGMIIGWLLKDCKKALQDNDNQWENRLLDTNNLWEQKIQEIVDEHNENIQEADFKIVNLKENINRAKDKIAILEQKLIKANLTIDTKQDEIKKIQTQTYSIEKELQLTKEQLNECQKNSSTQQDAQFLINTENNEEQEEEISKPTLLKEAKNGKKDNLTLVRGIGKVLEERLNKLGIYHFEQIASWTKSEQAWMNRYMSFPGRVEREEWVKQAKKLLKGIETEFAKRVKNGEIPTSKKE